MEEKEFEWLTEEICMEYLKRAKELSPNNGLDIGPWRDLRIELQRRCNLPEVYAYNIIRGHHIKEYIRIYDILSGRVPRTDSDKKDEKKRNIEEIVRKYEERIADLESFQNYAFGSDYGIEEDDD